MGRPYFDVFPTELGWVAALASPLGLRRLALKPSPLEALAGLGPQVDDAEQDPTSMEGIRNRFRAYIPGQVAALDGIALDLWDAPTFFRAAWLACRSIPPGETRSYGWLAEAAGRPRAYRAAGQAMGRNRFAIVIPCHRVIGSDGGLHGYGGGLDMKERLLALERRFTASESQVPSPTGSVL